MRVKNGAWTGVFKILAGLLIAVVSIGLCEYWVELSTSNVPGRAASLRFVSLLWNVGLLLTLFGILFALSGRAIVSGLVTLIAYLSFIFVHLQKLLHLGEPISPIDLVQVSEGLWLLKQMRMERHTAVFLFLTGLLIWLFLRALSIQIGPQVTYRLRAAVLIGCCFVIASFSIPSRPVWVDLALWATGTTNHLYASRYNASLNGALLSLFMNLSYLSEPSPPGHAPEAASRILAGFQDGPGASAPAAETVVLLLLEGFFDPTELPIRFEKDPIPYIRSLRRNFGMRDLLAPGFGGFTANTEFEILTAMPVHFFQVRGTVPFQLHIRRPLEALPSIFGRNQFRTFAIHPNRPDFYNRGSVYPLLGFDTFDSLESFRVRLDARGFVPDEAVIDAIIKRRESAQGKVFMFAGTIATHLPYPKSALPSFKRQYIADGQSPDLESVEVYSQLLTSTDQAVKKLIRHFEARKSPTLIVIFGDHRPALGPGLIGKMEPRYRTPLIVWKNYGRPDSARSGPLAAHYLPAEVLRAAGVQAPPFIRFTHRASQVIHQISSEGIHTVRGVFRADDPGVEESEKAVIHDYRILMYERLFGNG